MNGSYYNCTLTGEFQNDGNQNITLCNIGAIFTIIDFTMDANIPINITGINITIIRSKFIFDWDQSMTLIALNGTIDISKTEI